MWTSSTCLNIPISDISVGPTSTSTLLTLPVVASISFVAKIPPQVVLPALTLAVGLWFLLFGVLGLGFLLDLIPVFFCIALVTAFAIVTLTLQVPLLLGLLDVPPNFTTLIPDMLKNLGNLSGRTVAVSVSALVFLAALRAVYRRWGTESTLRGKASQLGVAAGGLLVIIIYTGVSSAFLGSLPLQDQLAPFIPPVSMDPGAPFAAGGGFPPQAGLGGGIPTQATLGGIPTQAAVGSNSTTLQAGTSFQPPRSNSTTTGSPLALVDPMLRRAVTITARQSSPPPAIGNFSTMSASTDGPPVVPKLPFWSAFPPFATTIPSTRPAPNAPLVQALFLPSLTVFLAINVEHMVVARFFAHEQGYTIAKSQEMFSLGLVNVATAFLGGVPVGGGDMTRASVLGFAGARSPLNQLFASGTVLLAMLPASGALRFLPQAALASLTFLAIFDQMPPQALMNVYFQMSFADFLAFFLVLNGAIAAPPGIGGLAAVAVGVLYMILYTIFRGMFAGPKVVRLSDLEAAKKEPWVQYVVVDKDAIPGSTLVVTSDVDLVWTNAERMHRHIMDAAFLYHSGTATEPLGKPEPAWSMRTQKHMRAVRARHMHEKNKTAVVLFRPRLRMVILDFSKVAFVDTSGLMNLELVKKQLRYWAGDDVEFRFVGLNKHLVRRFRRAKWPIMNPFDKEEEDYEDDMSVMKDLVFSTLSQALRHKSQDVGMDSTFEQIIEDGIHYGTAI